jgi:hypothetical protein
MLTKPAPKALLSGALGAYDFIVLVVFPKLLLLFLYNISNNFYVYCTLTKTAQNFRVPLIIFSQISVAKSLYMVL